MNAIMKLKNLLAMIIACSLQVGVQASDINAQDVINLVKAGKKLGEVITSWSGSHPVIPAVVENGKRVIYVPFCREDGTRVTWNIDKNEFDGVRAREALVEVINVTPEDRARIRLQAKEDKHGRKDPDRDRVIGHGEKIVVGVTSAAQGVYFVERWGGGNYINELLARNPSAALKVTIIRDVH